MSSQTTRAGDWVWVAGYRNETLHTGALSALLTNEQTGEKTLSWLLGEQGGKTGIVGSPKFEKKLGPKRGTPDLTIELDAQTPMQIAIETKCHSDATDEQLEKITKDIDGASGVLLAVGLTSLKIRPDDLDTPQLDNWTYRGADDWAGLLAELVDSEIGAPGWLPDYAAAVTAWSEALGNGTPSTLPTDEPRGDQVESLKQLADVRDELPKGSRGRPICESLSGFLLSFFDWCDLKGSGRDVFLELMAPREPGTATLNLKCGGTKNVAETAALIESRVDLDAIGPLRRSKRKIPRNAKSGTVALAELSGATAEETAAIIAEVRISLDQALRNGLE